jgi:hypothetical protein
MLVLLLQTFWMPTHLSSHMRNAFNVFDDLAIASPSPRRRPTFCALNVTGDFDPSGNFIPDDTSCPWILYAGKVLSTADNSSTPEELKQKESLIGRQKRNVVMIGESQECYMLDHFCATTLGSSMRIFPPRWTLPNGDIQVAPPFVPNKRGESYRLNFRACSYGNLTVASFFHFGFINGSKGIANSHTSAGEPREILDRIDNVLPKYLDDVFGKGYSLDAIVINSGLWDLHGMSGNREEQLKAWSQTNSSWNFQAKMVAEILEHQVPSTPIVWRNMPSVHGSDRFQVQHVELMNEVGISFAKSRNWRILDWRGPLLRLGASAVLPDGFHVGVVGRNLFMNRILNAVMDEHWKG